jgi:hypothetical protein
MKGKKPIFGRKDCWSMDHTLQPFLVEGIKKFREEVIRLRDEVHPMRSVPAHILPDEQDFEVRYNEWINILGKVLYAFQNIEPEYNGGWVEGPEHGKENEDGYFRYDMNPFDPDAWEEYIENSKEHTNKVREGLELFPMVWGSMWY